MAADNQNTGGPHSRLVGLIAEFDDSHALLHAGEHARESGYKKLDAFTPFPVHGIEKALGIPRTILPFIVLAIGMGGCVVGVLLQWYTNAASWSPIFPGYDFRISGKPIWSLPANIPVIFEIIVLSSAFAAFFGMLIMNQLPRLANPLHRVDRFKGASNDKFFLWVDASEDGFDLEKTRGQLDGWGAQAVEEVHEDLTDQKLPAFVKTAGVLVCVLMLIPPVLIYRARSMTARGPRLHVVPDMDFQVKYKAQQVGPDFASGKEHDFLFDHIRAAQQRIDGTVARGHMEADIEYYQGIKEGGDLASLQARGQFVSVTGQEDEAPPEPEWMTEFPSGFEVSRASLERGQKMFNIYCVACHGYAGDGDGLVNQRAQELVNGGVTGTSWTEAKSLFDPQVLEQPVGRLFDTVTHGRATMGPYGTRIKPEDRWAIVAYVKALQATRAHATSDISGKPPVQDSGAPTESGDNAGTGSDDHVAVNGN